MTNVIDINSKRKHYIADVCVFKNNEVSDTLLFEISKQDYFQYEQYYTEVKTLYMNDPEICVLFDKMNSILEKYWDLAGKNYSLLDFHIVPATEINEWDLDKKIS